MDREQFLNWIADRLVNKYGESENVDFIIRLRKEASLRQPSQVGMSENLNERIATITAHRACCGSEHDPAHGKFHGYCVVCGVPYPCEYASRLPVMGREK